MWTPVGVKNLFETLLIGPLDGDLIDRFPPRNVLLEDLSQLSPIAGNLALNLSHGVAGPETLREHVLIVSFVRLTDKSIREYELARTALTNFISNMQLVGQYVIAADHMENCIITLANLRYPSERLWKGHKAKSSRFIDTSTFKRIEDIRNDIIHNIENLEARSIPQPPLTVLMLENEIQLADHVVPYTELSALIKKIHGYAHELSIFKSNIHNVL